MTHLKSRLSKITTSKPLGLVLFMILVLMTAVLLAAPKGILSNPLTLTGKPPTNTDEVLKIQGKLSQSKFVQGANGAVYLEISIDTPKMVAGDHSASATDMIIILDRSGSMSEDNKLTYAKVAIQDVLSRLGQNDRFALIGFSDRAKIYSGLVAVTDAQRMRLNTIVASVKPGGGTNMGASLTLVHQMISEQSPNRRRKILLLSDGQANQGIVDPAQLAQLAAQIAHKESVVSTIGMGLGFNETLMASLADHGMGNYSYLESLAGLDQMLAKDLSDTRQIYATSSYLDLILSNGVRLVDAGGYPITTTVDAKPRVRVATGQLLGGTKKQFFMTFKFPTQHIDTLDLAKVTLGYRHHGQDHHLPISPETLQIAVLEVEKKREAVASIEGDVYKKSWLENNLGVMKRKLSASIRSGDKKRAKKIVSEYRHSVDMAAAESNMPLPSAALDDTLKDMYEQIEQSFAGSRSEQEIKRNRAAKNMQLDSRMDQRMTH